MSSALIRNDHVGRLTVAGVSIRPGAMVPIENWDAVKDTTEVASLLKLKLIAEVEPAKSDEPEAKTKAKG